MDKSTPLDNLDMRAASPAVWAEIERLRRSNDALVEALRLIADLGGKTLLGPEWDEERQHELGAAKAFEQCADIARAALALAKETP